MVLDAGNVEMKGCPPSKNSEAPFWKGVCVWGMGHGVGIRANKTIIVLQCRK